MRLLRYPLRRLAVRDWSAMGTRIALIAAVVVVVALAFWRPAPRPPIDPLAAGPTPIAASREHPDGRRHRRQPRESITGDVVVYVAGAVKRSGLYHLHPDDRAERAVALAGGFGESADAAGVNLAQRVEDGEEIYVPAVGETLQPITRAHRSRRGRSARTPPTGSVDLNRSDATALAAVPGIGRALGLRIVELREREGAFASLDELLDVAGMTQSRLERARPYLREP